MGALPKKKVSRRRRGNRRSHIRIQPLALGRCPQCQSVKPTHMACPTCGTYNGRVVLKVKTRKTG